MGATEGTGQSSLCQGDQKTTGNHPSANQRHSNKEPINNHEGVVDWNRSTIRQ